jgi:hypothetical protein
MGLAIRRWSAALPSVMRSSQDRIAFKPSSSGRVACGLNARHCIEAAHNRGNTAVVADCAASVLHVHHGAPKSVHIS